MPEIAVNIEGVFKDFESGNNLVHALQGVTCSAMKGELLMIVGPSGCGKTTFLSVIAGTLRADKGEVSVYDNLISQMNSNQVTEFRKKNVGFVFQQFHLIKTLSIRENVSIPLLLNGESRSIALEKADCMLENVGLKDCGDRKPMNLSGGQQQRVAIARGLIHEPLLLICDEPTSSLDADTGSHILELMTAVAKTPNRCVIVVTHDSRIFKFADRIVEMDDGKILKILSSKEMIEKKALHLL